VADILSGAALRAADSVHHAARIVRRHVHAARAGGAMMPTIQELREARGESQAELAEALHVSEREVSDWESGTTQPTITYFLALTKHFEVNQNDLIVEPKALDLDE
jgi:DNA-binding transcriptional regulator YiaG